MSERDWQGMLDDLQGPTVKLEITEMALVAMARRYQRRGCLALSVINAVEVLWRRHCGGPMT